MPELEIDNLKLEDFWPMLPNMGPPLPRFLNIYWPWYKKIYGLAQTCIEDPTGFPVTIDPSVDPRSDKIKAGKPVTLWQYLHNVSGEPMPSWSITMSVTYPDGTIFDLTEVRRDISAGEEWGYTVFSPFIPTFEDIYSGDITKRTYTVNVQLLIEGQVADELSLKLLAQVP